MNTQMPAFAVYNHTIFLGYVSAVSYTKAKAMAARKYPGKRLQVELPLNRKPRPSDRIAANIAEACKRAFR